MTHASLANTWTPHSWQQKRTLQQPTYRDAAALSGVVTALSKLPPLVVSWEVDALRERLAAAGRGEAFILQGGDCAESLDACSSDRIVSQLKILLQMSLVLTHGLRRPVVRVGRIAGQYAKPRSADTETRDGVTLPCYRGDIVNRPPFDAASREPDPELLLRGYERAALTLNFVRSLVDGGFTDLHHPEYWDLDFMKHSPKYEEYRRITDSLADSLTFFEHATGRAMADTQRIDFFASHEGLLLHYEQAQTRYIQRRGAWYNLATHLPWIGERTRGLQDGHIEYFRGIANPVAVKVGPTTDAAYLRDLCRILNPENIPGRLSLIHRLGAKNVEDKLPGLIHAIRDCGASVVWICDPMHGNTREGSTGHKTRSYDDVADEVLGFFQVHRSLGTVPGGIHVELTGDDVTECVGGTLGVTEDQVGDRYETACDPRLNRSQSLELAFDVADYLLDRTPS